MPCMSQPLGDFSNTHSLRGKASLPGAYEYGYCLTVVLSRRIACVVSNHEDKHVMANLCLLYTTSMLNFEVENQGVYRAE